MRHPIIGVWQLVSFDIVDNGGHRQPWGVLPSGTLIYTACGRVSVAINSQPVDHENSERAWLRSLIFYSGTYRLETNNRVRHKVHNASHENLLNRSLLRIFRLQGNQLEITAPNAKGTGSASVFWERATSLTDGDH